MKNLLSLIIVLKNSLALTLLAYLCIGANSYASSMVNYCTMATPGLWTEYSFYDYNSGIADIKIAKGRVLERFYGNKDFVETSVNYEILSSSLLESNSSKCEVGMRSSMTTNSYAVKAKIIADKDMFESPTDGGKTNTTTQWLICNETVYKDCN